VRTIGSETGIELLKLVPTLLWWALVVGVVYFLRVPLRDELLPRLTTISLFGVELGLAREQLDQAILNRSMSASSGEKAWVLDRLQRSAPLVRGARILWVDDTPDNNIHERRLLQSAGAVVDTATTTQQALSMLGSGHYDVVISDLHRPE
jgi:hypothetical protein